MQLFHYHWWTTHVEEVESFYASMGFQVTLRVGRRGADTVLRNPPLQWDDFRDESIAFRTVEMRRGQTNITFGQGRQNIFDHIGFLVTQAEYDAVCERANRLGWAVREGERRTFITTPWRLRVELQRRRDAVTGLPDTYLTELNLSLLASPDARLLGELLGVMTVSTGVDGAVTVGDDGWRIHCCNREKVWLGAVVLASRERINGTDPHDMRISSVPLGTHESSV